MVAKCFLRMSLASLSFFALMSASHANELTGLGDLTGGPFASYGYAISADGTVVIGESRNAISYEAFRWTQAGGMVGLGDLPGGVFSSLAKATNLDGSVIVGSGTSASGYEAFRWTQGGGMVGLGDLAGGSFNSFSNGVSADGAVVVGGGESASGTEAFRWTQGGGMVGLGDLAGGSFYSSAYGVSADGAVVIGQGESASGNEAFRWTQGGGMVGLGDLAGGAFYSSAIAISADGAVIVGQGTSASGLEAFRWTQAGGMVGLGDLAGGSFSSIAKAVSSDGSVIVGKGSSATGNTAFRWTQAGGMESVAAWLINAGVNISAFTSLSEANGVSSDGTIVVGSGTSSNGAEAFIARVSSIGSGIIDTPSTNKSAAETENSINLTKSAVSIVMNGAHHRPLILDANIENRKSCAWATTDAGYLGSGRNGYIVNEEVGLCADTLGKQVRIGAGLGLSQSRQGASFDGEQKLNGQYGVVEVNYRPDETNIILSLTGVYGAFDADMDRGYLNAGTNDLSQGKTDIQTASLRAAAYWEDAAEIQTLKLSPKISFTSSRSERDGYTEVGGGFPIQFADQVTNTHEIRAGVVAKKEISSQTEMRFMLEGVHKFKASGDGIGGEVIGLYSFNFANSKKAETWGRIGVDVDHRFDSGITAGASLFGASSGDVDPDISGAITLKAAF